MRKTLVANVVLVAIVIAAPCFGWGPEGHWLIGMVAWGYLNDRAKASVKDLLGDQSLADASNWADEIRKNPAYDWAKPLHYVNVPRDADRVVLSRDCPEEKCVIGAIKKYADVLRNKDAPREQRVEALKFLAHFVGDVHQPLHVSFADDRGGNQLNVTLFGHSDWNLHSVWDVGLIRHWIDSDREKGLKEIQAAINDRHLKKWRSSLDATEWANESLTITRRLYRELPAKKDLDEAYFKRNLPVVEERLAAAGVRLAALLNEVFGEPSATTKPSH